MKNLTIKQHFTIILHDCDNLELQRLYTEYTVHYHPKDAKILQMINDECEMRVIEGKMKEFRNPIYAF
jgi:hypothetical protein